MNRDTYCKRYKKELLLLIFFAIIISCKKKQELKKVKKTSTTQQTQIIKDLPKGIAIPEGMVWIPGGNFSKGAVKNDPMIMKHETPAHPVSVDGFLWI